MKLTWNGHSCFTITTQQGSAVLDPYLDGSVPGLSPLALTADAVFCSHDHKDHAARQVVTLTGQSFEAQVETLSTFHDDQQGALRGPNRIHILSAEGMRVAHLGDLGCLPTPEQLDRLQNLDALLIPVGGYYTIDAQQAQALIQTLHPRVVIPMHYRSSSFGYDVLTTVDDFLSLRGDVVRYSSNTMELTSQTPSQTAVLTYQP